MDLDRGGAGAMKIEEAELKTCPFSNNRPIRNCSANKCMMWRWKWNIGEDKPSKTEGYCGLAGRNY